MIEHYAAYHPLPLSIKHFVDFGKKSLFIIYQFHIIFNFTGVSPNERDAFSFLRGEMAVRLGNMIKEMDHLPTPLTVC